MYTIQILNIMSTSCYKCYHCKVRDVNFERKFVMLTLN